MTTKAKHRLIDLDALAEAAECLRLLAHPHRLRMIQMLLQGRYAVGELAEACEIPSHMASEHLRLMQRSGFLAAEKGWAVRLLHRCRTASRKHHELCRSPFWEEQIVFFELKYRYVTIRPYDTR